MDWYCILALGNREDKTAYEVMRLMLWYLAILTPSVRREAVWTQQQWDMEMLPLLHQERQFHFREECICCTVI